MCGAKAERQVFLFKRALLVAKKRDDVTMTVKVFIEVMPRRLNCCWKATHRSAFQRHFF